MNMVVDGIYGPKTKQMTFMAKNDMLRLNKPVGKIQLRETFLSFWRARYIARLHERPDQLINFNGWMKRVDRYSIIEMEYV